MTLWNFPNVFASSQRRAGTARPGASYDPTRTGDPLGPGHDRPAIGFGDTRIDVGGDYGEPRRRPIGFAPPTEETVPRYRTELSFKRHYDTPRASVKMDGQAEEPAMSWETPAGDRDETASISDAVVGAAEGGDSDELMTAADEKVSCRNR
jgi:hypothetical protein